MVLLMEGKILFSTAIVCTQWCLVELFLLQNALLHLSSAHLKEYLLVSFCSFSGKHFVVAFLFFSFPLLQMGHKPFHSKLERGNCLLGQHCPGSARLRESPRWAGPTQYLPQTHFCLSRSWIWIVPCWRGKILVEAWLNNFKLYLFCTQISMLVIQRKR